MQRKHNAELTHLARQLRKNMTEEERRLWYCFLHGHEARFSRQKVLGRYIADFYSAKANSSSSLTAHSIMMRKMPPKTKNALHFWNSTVSK